MPISKKRRGGKPSKIHPNYETIRDYKGVVRKRFGRNGKAVFIGVIAPCRKVARMRAKYNMKKEGIRLHDAYGGSFELHWRQYAAY